MTKEKNDPFYCIACGYVSPIFQKRCPSCGITDRFFSEREYAELMIRYLHHPLRKYRIFSLKTIKRLKWRDAIPELEERMRIEKDQDIKKEVQQTIEAIQTFVGRTSTESLGGAQKQPHMYTLGHEVTCKVIPIRSVLRKKGHHHLRPRRRL